MSTPRLTLWSWIRALPQFAVLGASIFVAYALLPSGQKRAALLVGGVAYLVYSFGSRMIITRHHRAGIRAFRRGRYGDAIKHYDESIAFFERHSWVDRFRAITVMSPSIWTYHEMALMNRAFAHSQLGDGVASRHGYERVIREYPQNQIAHQALRMLNSMKEKTERKANQTVESNAVDGRRKSGGSLSS